MLLAALHAALPSAGHAQTADRALADTMSARLDALQARTAPYARHLPTGREVAIRADVPVISLSVIKVPVMVAAFRAVEAGALDLDDRVPIEPDDLRGGGGLYEKMDPGLAPTYRDLITQMIIVSDNTATDLVVRRVGADAVNRLVDSLDYRETRLPMPTGDLFRALWLHTDSSTATLSGYDIFRRGFPSDVAAGERSFALEADSTRWLGRTTATTYCEGWSENRMPWRTASAPTSASASACASIRPWNCDVRVRGVRDEVRRDAVHADVLVAQVADDAAQRIDGSRDGRADCQRRVSLLRMPPPSQHLTAKPSLRRVPPSTSATPTAGTGRVTTGYRAATWNARYSGPSSTVTKRRMLSASSVTRPTSGTR